MPIISLDIELDDLISSFLMKPFSQLVMACGNNFSDPVEHDILKISFLRRA